MELEATVIIGTLHREAGRVPAPPGRLQGRVRVRTRYPTRGIWATSCQHAYNVAFYDLY